MKFSYFLFLACLFTLTSFEIPIQFGADCSGQYRLKFFGNKNLAGWCFDYREELLTLYKDSTFVLELISQGGFEVYPDSGIWTLTNSGIILKTKITDLMIAYGYVPKKRLFKIIKGGLVEPNCADKKLRKIMWKKE